MNLPVGRRAEAIEALGGLVNFSTYIADIRSTYIADLRDLPSDQRHPYAKSRSVKTHLEKWILDESPLPEEVAEAVENIFERNLCSPEIAGEVGAVLDGFDVVWPEFGARLKPISYNPYPHVPGLLVEVPDGPVHLQVDAYADRELEAAVVLVKHCVRRQPDLVRSLIKRAPALRWYLSEEGLNDIATLQRDYDDLIQRSERVRMEMSVLSELVNIVNFED